ncbi:proline-rich protein 32 [Perognathus longimembris pacificus]|uniref:proline-rich protein 32 n=1 Tax=Perognathus longimembris pacificus TaxID=214514 RepID=UPI00201A03D9|nr:proline-rich protein 32 [Perognathus longimembris pacificus]
MVPHKDKLEYLILSFLFSASFGGHVPSPKVLAVDENGNRLLHRAVTAQRPISTLKDDVDGAETWSHPPVPPRPPFTVLTDLPREQIQRPTERAGSCIPGGSRAPRYSYGLTAAVAEESLATAEVNSSEGLAGWRQKGHDSINKSQEVSHGPLTPMVGGTRVHNGVAEKGGNNIKSYAPLPQGKVAFPPRGPQTRNPPYLPTLRSGIMMEVPSGNTRMLSKGRLAHVSFPLHGPEHPVDNWQRPMPLSSSFPGFPFSSAHCFIPPQPVSFKPFLTTPVTFAAPPIFAAPLTPYFPHYHPRLIRSPASPNSEFK